MSRGSEQVADKDGDTFLTDMLFSKGEQKGRNVQSQMGGKNASASKAPARDDYSNLDDLDDEYRDMVFDIGASKALVQMADDFLDDKPMLALPAPEDYDSQAGISQSASRIDTRSVRTGKSNLSS